MRPEILSILNTIGYQTALRFDRSLGFQFWEPTDRGNRYFKDKQEAAESVRQLRKLSKLLQETSPHLIGLINDQAKTSVDWEQDGDPFFKMAYAVVDLTALAEMENIQIWKGRGASRRIAAEDIAKNMAKIFVLGMGTMPTSGAKDDGTPSGHFPNAIQDLFSCIGAPDNFRRPCKEAIAWLKADEQREYNRLIQRRLSNGQRASLTIGSERK